MRQTRTLLLSGAAAASVALLALAVPVTGQQAAAGVAAAPAALFETSDRCQACHNGLVTPRGEDASIGIAWRASIMANAARDPYWQAGVRREITQHPSAAAAIEHECSACHMPMMRYEAKAVGKLGVGFDIIQGTQIPCPKLELRERIGGAVPVPLIASAVAGFEPQQLQHLLHRNFRAQPVEIDARHLLSPYTAERFLEW